MRSGVETPTTCDYQDGQLQAVVSVEKTNRETKPIVELLDSSNGHDIFCMYHGYLAKEHTNDVPLKPIFH